jgi:hypothetical protein
LQFIIACPIQPHVKQKCGMFSYLTMISMVSLPFTFTLINDTSAFWRGKYTHVAGIPDIHLNEVS